MPSASNRFLYAMLAYGALATSAFFTLTGDIRIFILILLGGLAVLTWSAMEREKLREQEREEQGSGTPDSQ